MLWRKGYETGSATHVELPQGISDGVWVVIFDPAGLKDAEIWRKLLVAEGVGFRIGLKQGLLGAIEAFFPASVLASVIGLEGLGELDRGGRTVALVASGGVAELVMWGPPTEEALDEFLGLIR